MKQGGTQTSTLHGVVVTGGRCWRMYHMPTRTSVIVALDGAIKGVPPLPYELKATRKKKEKGIVDLAAVRPVHAFTYRIKVGFCIGDHFM